MFSHHVKFKLFTPQFRSFVKNLHQNLQPSSHSSHQSKSNHQSSTTFSGHHVYQNIYPWNRLSQFSDHLLNNILYSDERIVAIAKPFGVGIYTPYDPSTHPDKIEPKMFGDPRYCINDALENLSSKLKIPDLSICITENRILSGIVVLSKSEIASKKVKKEYNRLRNHHYPLFTFHCLTYGAPMIKEPIVKEVVTIREVCVNESTGQREPEIYYNYSKAKTYKTFETRRVTATLQVLDYNTSLNVALVEISCNRTNFHFVRCYLASKACFILGDTRFSRRVGHVLGVPYVLKPTNLRPREEPLTNAIRKCLNVSKNKSIPLMLHQRTLSFEHYSRNTTVNIENNYPKHFIWTANKLLGTNYQ